MRIVVALGGNALGKTPEEQLELVKETAKQIVNLVVEGHEVVVVHGNGPQVGMINLAFDSSYQNEAGTPLMPFAECGAMSQGYIGYHLQQTITDELNKRKINKECVTVVTQVEVDPKDSAFKNPTKPVGMFYTKEQAEEIEKEKGYIFVEDAGRGYRRVVPSPKPKDIVEQDVIRNLVSDGNIVITCGGGGIPVRLDKKDGYEGVDAVIDKDFAACKLAKVINADVLLILTAVSKVCIRYNQPDEKKLDVLSLEEAQKYVDDGEFAKGSMLPKVEACMDFVRENEDGIAIISALKDGVKALKGSTGTRIVNAKKEEIEKVEVKRKNKKKKMPTVLSAFSIVMLILFVLGGLSHLLPQAQFIGGEIVNGSGVVGAKLSDILMSPILGFQSAIDVSLFVIVFGAFLAVITKTGAFDAGVKVLVKKLNGREHLLIPIMMFIFSIGGTIFSVLEETIVFYALLSAIMVALGMDTIVAAATILLGVGVGILGSTINPFVVGSAVESLSDGIIVNKVVIIVIGFALWITSYIISVLFVMNYAKKVMKDKGSTFLSLQEQKAMEKRYGKKLLNEKIEFTGKQKLTLWVFGLSFLVLILGFIPWDAFGIEFFLDKTGFLTGSSIGNWWFNEGTLWLLVVTILLCVINGFNEKEIVNTFIDGANDMINVVLIIGVVRGVSVLIGQTYLDNYIIYTSKEILNGMPAILYVPCNFIINLFLSILVPESSRIASLSMPFMGTLTSQLGYSVEVNVMTLVAANGLAKLISPTCGAIMGGLAIARVEYPTWVKWSWRVVLYIGLATLTILTLAMLIF